MAIGWQGNSRFASIAGESAFGKVMLHCASPFQRTDMVWGTHHFHGL
ncbi:hypothetical protein VAD52_002902 [Yersinia enterocolitica]|nr:hypothetical protein [Yersinia enterocolitica]ELX2281569.1 hypothetical protein [Yersinia enterocolitica]EMA2898266.1 hypothetical protein [Yersinia enterocolitica]EMB6582923.1 hypothetical protein [Yersinia enterocolitica]